MQREQLYLYANLNNYAIASRLHPSLKKMRLSQKYKTVSFFSTQYEGDFSVSCSGTNDYHV